MRQWSPPSTPGKAAGMALGSMIRQLGEDGFEAAVLRQLQPWVPAASWSVYRTGTCSRPTLYLGASVGIPDRTRDCWSAYLSGPYRGDRSFGPGAGPEDPPSLCHVTAGEIPEQHRTRVYQAHGMAERISVVAHDAEGTFAVNLYRHEHQAPFTDGQIADFGTLALPVLELARKHVRIRGDAEPEPERVRERLLQLAPDLTTRELEVCIRLLQGMTQEGVARDLRLAFTTVKTYRNRAYARLGVHFRNELFARVLGGA